MTTSDKVVKFTMLDSALHELDHEPRKPVHLVLDNIRSAFNVGSAFRTGDAARVERIHLGGISAYPPNSKLEKTALGSTSVVPWNYYPSTYLAIKELKAAGVAICAVELTNSSVNFWDYAYPSPVALVFGNEVYGIQEEVLYLADSFVYIPMHGKKTTLNVSTSLGVVLFEVLRQWNTHSE